jgi:hypothetical protein
MNESWMRVFLNYVIGILATLVTGFFTLFIALYRKHTEKLESNEARIAALEAGRVTNQQLESAMSTMRSERKEMHEQNLSALQRIEDKQDTNKDIISKICSDVAVLAERLSKAPSSPRSRRK